MNSEKNENKMELKDGEYKARIEVKDSIGTSQSMFTTLRSNVINGILTGSRSDHIFARGHTIIIEMVPKHENFTSGLFTER